ncbi:hypothetical protein E2C01_004512 [Portunus trituberculatus]|uniref:Uncharacterized protein n=1 Tax=Portunus trituberculatus TaxID=210409 RepID=A0A5B7CRZ0_PORTR|nr:hypothetical protein [Portunus trituberculatus]
MYNLQRLSPHAFSLKQLEGDLYSLTRGGVRGQLEQVWAGGVKLGEAKTHMPRPARLCLLYLHQEDLPRQKRTLADGDSIGETCLPVRHRVVIIQHNIGAMVGVKGHRLEAIGHYGGDHQ